MANIKITELDEALSITNNDYMVIDDGTSTKKYKASNMGQVDDVTVDGTSVVTNKVAVIDLSGKENADATILKQSNVVDNLSSDSSIYPLSAKQGKVLKTQSDRTDRSLDYLWKKSKGVIYDTEVINGTTYDVDIPSGAMEYAECQMIGGMSRKGYQLLPLASGTSNGVAFTYNADGTLTLNGTCTTDRINIKGSLNIVLSGTYTLTNKLISGTITNNAFVTAIKNSSYTSLTSASLGENKTLTSTDTITSIVCYTNQGIVFTNAIVKLMLTSGSSEQEIEPYSSSLLDAKVDKQISNGVNLFNKDTSTPHSRFRNGELIDTTGTTYQTAYASDYIECSTISNITYVGGGVVWYDINKNVISYNDNKTTSALRNRSKPEGAWYFRFDTNADNTMPLDECMCVSGTYSSETMPSYKPYFNHEYPINSNIQALEGYGLGINNTCYNYVSFTPTTYHNMKSVDLGTLTWGGTSGAYTTTLSGYVGNPLHSSIPSTSFSYSGTTLTVNSSTTPSGILHYEATSGGTDYNAYLYHKKVGSVDLGSLTYSKHSFGNVFFAILPNAYYETGYSGRNKNVLISIYNASTVITLNDGMDDKSWLRTTDQINIKDNAYTDATAFKNAMNGIICYYQLATEQIIDITPYCEQDFNIREIEANGILQNHYPLLDNGYGINMNSTLEVMVNVNEV